MAQARVTVPSQAGSSYLLVPILILFALLIVAVMRGPSLISSAGIGSAVIVTAPLVLATYGLMATAMAGRGTVDLSVGPLLGFINVTLVQLNGLELVTSPLAVFAYVIAAGVAYQFLLALVIIFVRVQPIIVSLSGYLALSGINLVILPRPGGAAPEWMLPWGAGTEILSPVLTILVISTAAWLLFTRTAFYGHLRLMGSDERAAYTSGVRISIVRIGAHCISGVFIGLAALAYTALIGSGDPTQGTTYTLISITALVLGGTSLAGGRGGAVGSLLGATNLFLIGYVLATFNFGMVQGFVTDLAYGVILVLSLLLTVALPHLQRYVSRLSPFLVFVVLAIPFASVMLHVKHDYSRYVTPSIDVPTATGGEPATTGVPATVVGDLTTTASVPAATIGDPMATVGVPAVSVGDAASPVAAVPSQPKSGRLVASFIFEQQAQPADEIELTTLQRSAALAALVLFALVLFTRVVVSQTGLRGMTPILYAGLAAIVVVGVWLVIDMTSVATPNAGTATGASR